MTKLSTLRNETRKRARNMKIVTQKESEKVWATSIEINKYEQEEKSREGHPQAIEAEPKEQISKRNWPDPQKPARTVKERREGSKDKEEP